MKYSLLLLILPMCVNAASSGSSAGANASGTVVNNSPYNGVVIDSNMPETTFSRDLIICPTAKLDLALLPSYHRNDYVDDSGITAMLSYSMPLDMGGVLSRCQKQQKALIRQAELQADRQERLSTFEIMDKCIELKKAGVQLVSVKSFPWAKHCDGIMFKDGVRLQRNITYKE